MHGCTENMTHAALREPSSPFAGRGFPLRTPLAAALAALVLLAGGCETEPKPVPAGPDYARELAPGENALRLLGPNDPLPDLGTPYRLRDPFLTQALDRSIQWFEAPSSRQRMDAWKQYCTWEQASASVRAFKQLLQESPDEATFVAAVKENFQVWQTIGYNRKGVVLFTGYYTPEFKGSLTQSDEFKYPLFKRPADLVTDPVTGEPKGRRMPDGSTGEWPGRRQLIESGAFKGTELVWLRSALDVYIIEVNGSAKVLLPDGRPFYVGYAGKTGRPYVGLGKSMVDAGLIPRDKLSLKAIMDAYEKNPAQVEALMWKNENMVFFSTYDGGNWPAGSLGVRVTEKESLATDKKVYPPGGVVLVNTQAINFGGTWQPFARYMLDQDTGGAIKAPGRADIYMGIGKAAEILAGGQYSEGTMFYFFLKPEKVAAFSGGSAASRSAGK